MSATRYQICIAVCWQDLFLIDKHPAYQDNLQCVPSPGSHYIPIKYWGHRETKLRLYSILPYCKDVLHTSLQGRLMADAHLYSGKYFHQLFYLN